MTGYLNIQRLLKRSLSLLLSWFLILPVVLTPSGCHIVLYARCSTNSSASTPISVNRVSPNYKKNSLFAKSGYLTENTQSVNNGWHGNQNVTQSLLRQAMSYSFHICVYFYTLLLLFVWLTSKLVMIPGPDSTNFERSNNRDVNHLRVLGLWFWLGNY